MDFRVVFEGVPDTLVAGDSLRNVVVRYFDRNNNPTDNSLGRVVYSRAGGSSTATVQASRLETGVYALSATQATIAGAYTLNVSGISAVNIEGKRTFDLSSLSAVKASFILSTSAMNAAGSVLSLNASFFDKFNNPTDLIPGLALQNSEFNFTDTVGLTRVRKGVYSTRKRLTLPGEYFLKVDSIPETPGLEPPEVFDVLNNKFSLEPGPANLAVFVNVPTTLAGGTPLPRFTVMLFDRRSAPTDYLSTNEQQVTVSAPATALNPPAFLLGIFEPEDNQNGTYNVMRVDMAVTEPMKRFTDVGRYTLTVPGCTRYQGTRVFTVQTPPPVSVSISGVRTPLITGEQQNSITLTFRDAQGNLADFTGGLSFSGAENGTLALTKVSTGIYTAVPRTFTVAGTYTLSIAGLTAGGNTAFVVNTPPAATVVLSGVRTPMNAGGQQINILLTFRDAQGNLTDFTGALAFSGAANGSIALTRQSIGLYRAAATSFTTPGTYTLSIAGLTVSGETTFTVVAGNIVTFRNDQMFVNGNRFFPLGWYADSPTAPGNVVLPYYHEVVSRYYPGILYDTASSSTQSIISAFRRFLNDATGLVILHLPETNDDKTLLPDAVWQAVVRDSIIRTHRNFLGWYNADEPENVAYKDDKDNDRTFERYYTTFVGQTRVPNYPYYKQRYDFIKQNDPNHPVFVTSVTPKLFRDYFQQIPLPEQPNSGASWPTDLPARWKWNTYTGKFYDILLVDYYPMSTKFSRPSLDAYGINSSITGLRDNYRFVTPTATEGAAMYVAQGAGREFGHRDFDLRELAFTCFHSMYTMQLNENQMSRSINLGGILFWSFPYSTPNTRDTVAAFVNFFQAQRLDSVLWGVNRNSNIASLTNFDNTSAEWHLFRYMREYNGSYYLVVINTFNRDRTPTPRTASVNLSVNLPWQNAQCEELLLRGGIRTIALNFGTGSVFSFTSPIRFDTMETKVFRFSSRTALASFDAKATSFSSGVSGASNTQPSEVLPQLPVLEIFPNPSHDKVVITLRFKEEALGNIKIYDALGKEMYCSQQQQWKSGEHKVEMSAESWASGTYICGFSGQGYQHTIQFQIIH